MSSTNIPQRSSQQQSRHQVTGNWRLGLLFSVITMLSWASLPLALAVTLQSLDVWSVTWFRMLVAAILLPVWLIWRRSAGRSVAGSLGWPQIRQHWPVLVLAAAMLCGNYVFYLFGLANTTPANAQVIIQVAPVLMALGGMLFFGERYTRWQWAGFVLLIVALVVFFRDQLGVLGNTENYLLGVGFMLAAAVSWAAYALLQKTLMSSMRALQIMLFIYCFSALVLLPATDFTGLAQVSVSSWLWLLFCGLNTLSAYGAFGEAMHHWEASRVSAVIAITPLGTIVVLWLASILAPALLAPEQLDLVSIVAAVVVVIGSMITSLAGRKKSITPVPPASPDI